MKRAHGFVVAATAAVMLAPALTRCARTQTAPEAPATRPDALAAFARCAFDTVPASAPAPALEASVRAALRRDRYTFAVRVGRCTSAFSPELRARDPRAAALYDAWEALLPLAQAGAPDPIATDRAIRHVGNAWRAAQ